MEGILGREDRDGKTGVRGGEGEVGRMPAPQEVRGEIDMAVANLSSAFRKRPRLWKDSRTEDGQVVTEGSLQ